MPRFPSPPYIPSRTPGRSRRTLSLLQATDLRLAGYAFVSAKKRKDNYARLKRAVLGDISRARLGKLAVKAIFPRGRTIRHRLCRKKGRQNSGYFWFLTINHGTTGDYGDGGISGEKQYHQPFLPVVSRCSMSKSRS